MSDIAVPDILALIPRGMQAHMEELESAVSGRVRRFVSVEEMIHDSPEHTYAVALIPATGFSPEEWWSVWGFLNEMDPRPCILVFALKSDFGMWTSILGSGCFDVITAPFTAANICTAIVLASAEFARRIVING